MYLSLPFCPFSSFFRSFPLPLARSSSSCSLLFIPLPLSQYFPQYFEDTLQQELVAQSKYYEDQETFGKLATSEPPEWFSILRSPSNSLLHPHRGGGGSGVFSGFGNTLGIHSASSQASTSGLAVHSSTSSILSVPDNISIRSAPPLFNRTPPPPSSLSSSLIGHKRTRSAVSSPPTNLSRSPTARPKSLYIPFQGCVENPPAPPGRAARDILNALSYAPTHERYSSSQEEVFKSSQGSLSSSRSSGASWASSAGSMSPKFSNVLPCIPQSPPRLRSKSSSMATLMAGGVTATPPATSPISSGCHHHRRITADNIILPLSYSTQEMLLQVGSNSPPKPSSPVTDFRTRLITQQQASLAEPVYSPTNPLNHSENLALHVMHPPVIQPPPDIVHNDSNLILGAQNNSKRCLLTPGASVSSNSSSFETARGSPHSGTSSGNSAYFEFPATGVGSSLEAIKENSPTSQTSHL